MTPERLEARNAVLARAGFGEDAEIGLLAADASFRSYDRVRGRDGRSAVIMNAPPDKEDVRPFHRIADLLTGWKLSAPQVLAADPEAGFLVLEDLGDDLFSTMIANGHDQTTLYRAAVDVLVEIGRQSAPADVPAYDMSKLLEEVQLLLEWRFPEVTGRAPNDAETAAFVDAWHEVLAPVAGVQDTLVLRDYHVDNLIWLPARSGTACVGLLDFQDALRGHAAYDLASLLSDVRRDVPRAVELAMLARFTAATKQDAQAFRSAYAILAAQRNVKIIGIFTRLWRRDGKPGYLRWLSRCWRLLRRDLGDPALAPVARWFEMYFPEDPAEQVEATE